MRVQLYPRNNVAFVGPKTVEISLERIGPDFVEFDSSETGHPFFSYVARFISIGEERLVEYSPLPKRPGLCWGQTSTEDGHRVNVFTFDNAGDKLPWHTHDEHTVHTSQVTQGSLTAVTEQGEFIISAGDPVLDWQPGEWHEFVAIKPGSVLRNWVKRPVG